ncbi:cytochrome c5 [Luteibacter sp. Sphag1AF]|uniref:c-type cytochrome n=1 Tax=Luteibacter sp. Sphag1AF TaxID=2587031 RepID=UPI00179BFEFA|nr:cytochrome c5 [Luteibacter sp. Sphag1AF]
MSGSPSKSDQNFVRQFSWLTLGLSVLALVLMVIAYSIYSGIPKEQDPTQTRAQTARIAPVGGVYAGDTGRAAMAAAQEAAAKAAAAQVAYGGSTDGKTIYDNLCHSCHTAGVAGAPKLGDKGQWGTRIAEGTATLIKHAIEGYTGPDGNHMPAKGGNPSLTDEQVENTVKWMVDQAK